MLQFSKNDQIFWNFLALWFGRTSTVATLEHLRSTIKNVLQRKDEIWGPWFRSYSRKSSSKRENSNRCKDDLVNRKTMQILQLEITRKRLAAWVWESDIRSASNKIPKKCNLFCLFFGPGSGGRVGRLKNVWQIARLQSYTPSRT